MSFHVHHIPCIEQLTNQPLKFFSDPLTIIFISIEQLTNQPLKFFSDPLTIISISIEQLTNQPLKFFSDPLTIIFISKSRPIGRVESLVPLHVVPLLLKPLGRH